MSHFVTEVPLVIIKPGKMIINYSSPKMKALLGAVIILLYIYFLLFLKTLYMKSKRLDQIMTEALETEQEIRKLHELDEKLSMQIADLENMYEDH